MKWVGAAGLCLMVIGFATPAAAQNSPKAEISGGYHWFTGKASSDDTWEKFPNGWYFDVAGNVTDTVSVVGQVTGSYKTFEDDGEDFKLKLHTYMFGVRGSSPGRVRGFGQVLVGGVSLKGSAGTFSASETDLGVQIGGGVNVMGSGNVGLRLGVDYTRVMAKEDGVVLEGDDVNGFSFKIGVTFGVGSR